VLDRKSLARKPQKIPPQQKMITPPLNLPLNSPPSPAATYRPELTPFAQSLHYDPVNHLPPSAPLSGLATAATASDP